MPHLRTHTLSGRRGSSPLPFGILSSVASESHNTMHGTCWMHREKDRRAHLGILLMWTCATGGGGERIAGREGTARGRS